MALPPSFDTMNDCSKRVQLEGANRVGRVRRMQPLPIIKLTEEVHPVFVHFGELRQSAVFLSPVLNGNTENTHAGEYHRQKHENIWVIAISQCFAAVFSCKPSTGLFCADASDPSGEIHQTHGVPSRESGYPGYSQTFHYKYFLPVCRSHRPA